MVIKEIGIDISGQYSKSAEEFHDTIFDLAVTVCDRAKQACPICSTQLEFPAKSPNAREVIHRSFEDPAQAGGSEEEQLKVFRRVRRRYQRMDNSHILAYGHAVNRSSYQEIFFR
ncbi:MAG: hypothetical protein NTX42_08780 [Methanothrix sp.]|nr:hypothetical protein [Methanothrix sp.]